MSSVGLPIFVVTVLIAGTAAAIVLTPKDVLRSTVVEAPAPSYAVAKRSSDPEFFPVETAQPAVQFASLTVSVTPLAEPIAEAAPAPGTRDIRRITADSLNMRTEPNQYSSHIASLPRGTQVTVSDTAGSWAYVTTPDGTTGWLSQNFLARVE